MENRILEVLAGLLFWGVLATLFHFIGNSPIVYIFAISGVDWVQSALAGIVGTLMFWYSRNR